MECLGSTDGEGESGGMVADTERMSVGGEKACICAKQLI